MSDHDLRLISFDICPYVERSRIVLEEKQVPYEVTFVDLGDKPDWFVEISPRGKVPVLVADGRPIFESMVINELLEELCPSPPLLRGGPIDRADARAWIVFCNDVLMPEMYMMWVSPKALQRDRHARRFAAGLAKLEAKLAQRDAGPYLFGAEFNLADATYAPIFTRWEANKALIAAPDPLDDLPLTRAYGEALSERPSVLRSQARDLVALTIDYARRRRAA